MIFYLCSSKQNPMKSFEVAISFFLLYMLTSCRWREHTKFYPSKKHPTHTQSAARALTLNISIVLTRNHKIFPNQQSPNAPIEVFTSNKIFMEFIILVNISKPNVSKLYLFHLLSEILSLLHWIFITPHSPISILSHFIGISGWWT